MFEVKNNDFCGFMMNAFTAAEVVLSENEKKVVNKLWVTLKIEMKQNYSPRKLPPEFLEFHAPGSDIKLWGYSKPKSTINSCSLSTEMSKMASGEAELGSSGLSTEMSSNFIETGTIKVNFKEFLAFIAISSKMLLGSPIKPILPAMG